MNEKEDKIELTAHIPTGGDIIIRGGGNGAVWDGAGGEFTIGFVAPPQPPPALSFQGPDGKRAVIVYFDGTVEYGEGYTPSDAAKLFWQAVRWYGQKND